MAQTPVSKASSDAQANLVLSEHPPDDRLWKRYSPHHELPVSGISSLFVHILVCGLLVLAGIVVAKMGTGGGAGPSLDVVALSGESESGVAATSSHDDRVKEPRHELVPPAPVKEANPAPNIRESTPEPPKPNAFHLPTINPRQGAEADAASRLRELGEEAHKKLLVAPSKQLATGPPGGGGKTGPGDGTGPPGARIKTEREQRQLRWTMTFSTKDGNDYLQQLKSLGAILAYEGPNGEYLVIRDLGKRPAIGKAEPLPNQIYWIDDRPESVQSLASALGIPAVKKIVALFPEDLEKEMLRKELAYAGRKEGAILETRFKVVRTSRGYEPRVIEQTPVR
jgi:hypothetical protein